MPMLVQNQPELDPSKLIEIRQPSSPRCVSQSFCPTVMRLGELTPCTKDVWTDGLGMPLRSLSQAEIVQAPQLREWICQFMCTYLVCVLGRFYSVEENVIVVLTKHFDLLCNDDCLAGGRTIITVLDDWQVLLDDVSWCLTMQSPVPSTCWWYGVVCSNQLTWTWGLEEIPSAIPMPDVNNYTCQ